MYSLRQEIWTRRVKLQYLLEKKTTPSQVRELLKPIGKVELEASRKSESKFYDTFDWRLYAQNASLLVRSNDIGTEIRLWNFDGRAAGNDVFVQDGESPIGFVWDLPEGALQERLAKIIDVRRLSPYMTLKSVRRKIAVRNRDDKMVLRLVLEKLSVRRDNSDIVEDMGEYLVVEPLRGYEKTCGRTQKILKRHFGSKISKKSLYHHAMSSVGVTPGGYSSKLSLGFAPSFSAGDAVREIHLRLLDTMVRNENGAAKNIDAEFLHDFRVAIRRTRSALAQIDKGVLPASVVKKAQEDFRWIGQQTNYMRDLDVYLIDYPSLKGSLPVSYQTHLGPFKNYLERESAVEIKKIVSLMRGKRYRKIVDEWRAFLLQENRNAEESALSREAIKAVADRKIWKAYARVIKEGKAIGENSPAESLHDLRGTCKKLRYLLEFFQHLYPQQKIDNLVASLKKFQNILGIFQDTEIQSTAILTFGRRMTKANAAPVETQMAMGMVADSILKRQGLARRNFDARFGVFARPAIHKKFEALFRNRVT
jgi:CHAD domain-containing protein